MSNKHHYFSIIKDAESIIKEAIIDKKNIAVAVSGGKDSVAMTALVCKFCKPKIIWNDSKMELPESKLVIEKLAAKYNLNIIIAEGNAISDYIKYKNSNEYKKNKDDVNSIIIPVKKAIEENNIDIEFVGLRKNESKTRKILLKKYGAIHKSKRWGITISWPMRNWEGIDSLAYADEFDLPIHPAYLRNVEPDKVRVSWLYDMSRESFEQVEYLRKFYPDIFRKFREFGICQ